MSSENDKNETSRFLGEGMSFKAKLIGILEVSEARGDRMCQEALSDLKVAIRAAGEHKQRIIINVAIDGLRLRDEKTGDSLYHHPVHKISFIAQDMTDTRAFGYIFGSPDTGHRFFGIKTDKAASQVVIAMRDLFQVVFALKKKEIELAKQSLEKNYCYNRDTPHIFNEETTTDTKNIASSNVKNFSALKSEAESSNTKPNATPAVANLVDLEIELTNLQQGISQIEQLTPSDPFNTGDPFGDSFINYTPGPILPPPPSSGKERFPKTSTGSSSSKVGVTAELEETLNSQSVLQSTEEVTENKTSNDFQQEFFVDDWFNSSRQNRKIDNETTSEPLITEKENDEEQLKQFDVFTELDPLGTGKIKPYIHKKDFFQDLKKPKKVLNDLVNDKQIYSGNDSSSDGYDSFKSKNLILNENPFGDDPFVKNNFNVDFELFEKEQKNNENIGDTKKLTCTRINEDSLISGQNEKDFDKFSSGFDLNSNNRKKLISESDFVPQPPPRPTNSVCTQPPPLPPKKQLGDVSLKPPPRPPHSDDTHYAIFNKEFKKDENDDEILEMGPPLPAPARKIKTTPNTNQQKQKIKLSNADSSDDGYLTPITFPHQKEFNFNEKNKSFDEDNVRNPDKCVGRSEGKYHTILNDGSNIPLASLNFMLSQLTLSDLNDLAVELKIPKNELSNMTLCQITTYLSNIIKNNKFQNESRGDDTVQDNLNFADFSSFESSEPHDKYAVFRELEATELRKNSENNESPSLENLAENQDVSFNSLQNKIEDKYAALRKLPQSEVEVFDKISESLEEEEDCEESRETPIKDVIEDDSFKNNKINSQSSSEEKKESPSKSITNEPSDSVFEEDKLQAYDSASEGASGTSPEIDETEVVKENNKSGENWAVFDDLRIQCGEKNSLQSEEGASPWSSDSKEFGNTSPDLKMSFDLNKKSWEKQKSIKKEEQWWDASTEPEAECRYSNRLSTDSFEEEYSTYSKNPRDKLNQATVTSPGPQAVGGGHSSSSRDVSPWEEEGYLSSPKKSDYYKKHSRQTCEGRDSWDEDEYDYDEEQYRRYCWPDRHGNRQFREERFGRGKDWAPDHWGNERNFWKQEVERRRHCCKGHDFGKNREGRYYSRSKHSNGSTCPPKYPSNYQDPYFSRSSHDFPWEDEYHEENTEMQQHPYYANNKNSWKRPSSASEVEKKSEEMRNNQIQYYMGTGGSDGEKDRRYKGNRRSKNRHPYYCEMNVHHKGDPNFPPRSYHKPNMHTSMNVPLKGDEQEAFSRKAVRGDLKSNNYSSSGAASWKNEFGRKQDNTFKDSNKVPSFDSYGFDNNETKIPDPGKFSSLRKPIKSNPRTRSFQYGTIKDNKFLNLSPEQRLPLRRIQKSPFEDDFSPLTLHSNNQIEQNESFSTNEEDDYFNPEMTNKKNTLSKKLNTNKLNTINTSNDGLKKSESVNIFAREQDPFDDDDFFGENAIQALSEIDKQ